MVFQKLAALLYLYSLPHNSEIFSTSAVFFFSRKTITHMIGVRRKTLVIETKQTLTNFTKSEQVPHCANDSGFFCTPHHNSSSHHENICNHKLMLGQWDFSHWLQWVNVWKQSRHFPTCCM